MNTRKRINIDKRNDMFAATPPLEALRCLISLAASDSSLHLDFLDVYEDLEFLGNNDRVEHNYINQIFV